jgi:CheY-like chemotaxis protein
VRSTRPRSSSDGLPPSSRRGEPPSSRRSEAPALGGGAPISCRDGRYQVLVVDDEPAVVESIAAVLCDDVDVTTALSGVRALALIERTSFHVVCSDYLMPDMDGAALLNRAAALPAPIGCLMITGAEEYFRKKSEIRHYVLLKPVDPRRLLSMVLHLARLTEMKRSVERLSSGMRR